MQNLCNFVSETLFIIRAQIKLRTMNVNAIAVANYFIELANSKGVQLRQMGLMKRVYITHGFCLALYDKPALDPRFDMVEAWRHGPVIPSVYHSFKYNGNNPITDMSCIIEDIQKDGDLKILTPKLHDEDVKKMANMVWELYKNTKDFELVELLHRQGTPWALCYVEGQNKEIPDLYTSAYYRKLWNAWTNQK